jgi:hypothetical protein
VAVTKPLWRASVAAVCITFDTTLASHLTLTLTLHSFFLPCFIGDGDAATEVAVTKPLWRATVAAVCGVDADHAAATEGAKAATTTNKGNDDDNDGVDGNNEVTASSCEALVIHYTAAAAAEGVRVAAARAAWQEWAVHTSSRVVKRIDALLVANAAADAVAVNATLPLAARCAAVRKPLCAALVASPSFCCDVHGTPPLPPPPPQPAFNVTELVNGVNSR